jgi:hypothetical protein
MAGDDEEIDLLAAANDVVDNDLPAHAIKGYERKLIRCAPLRAHHKNGMMTYSMILDCPTTL